MVQHSVNYFTLHYLLLNPFGFGFQPRVVSRQKILDISSDNSAKSCRPNMSTLINDDAYFFHWMIVVRNGQTSKYSRKVFKYQHQYYFGYLNSIETLIYTAVFGEVYLNTVVEVQPPVCIFMMSVALQL